MKNRKGFTLIELLAVIVILGLLMAIAIPSVTKYITESRKKTVTTTVNNYIGALVNEVNDLAYTFTGNNTIYAVPIECISLERGGTSPFGEWMQANDNYWAYVLIQYDDTNSKYVYGFTFKDSAGYGLYPTIQSKIKEKGSQIKTGLDLNRPVSGDLTSLTTLAKWQQSGFDVSSTTDFKVLEATSEGELGNGETTCTLCQKGKNYAQVEEEKTNKLATPLYFGKPYEMISDGISESYFFYEDGSMKYYYDCELDWSESTGSFEYKNNQIIFVEDEEVWFDISEDKKSILYSWDGEEYVYSLNQSSNWCVDPYADLPMLRKQSDSVAFWQYSKQIKTITFQNSINVPSSVASEHKWDMTKSQNGKVMAYIIPNSSDSSYYDLYIQGDEKIYANPDSSSLFSGFSYLDSINNIEILDTSKVTNMRNMFANAGYNATTFNLGDISGWDTSNVTNMDSMFRQAGYNAKTFNIKGLNKWNTTNVTSIGSMFHSVGYNATAFELDLSGWDTSNVTQFSWAFSYTGNKSSTYNIVGLDKWDTSNVINMDMMFANAGGNAKTFNIGDLSNWNTAKVENMANMFLAAGRNATTFDIGNLGNWNTSNVSVMGSIFQRTGENATTFNIGDLRNWDTSNVTYMDNMFYYAGYKATYSLDCSSWNVKKVTSYTNFNTGVTSKVKVPSFGT